jgi:hypothetical protein
MDVDEVVLEANYSDIIIYIYSDEEELFQIYNLISTLMYHEETVIVLLTICASANTIAIVYIFTYMVAVKISRPLRKLITIAGIMNSGSRSKSVTEKIIKELDQIQA